MPNSTVEHRARLFRSGYDQTVRIPHELELPGQEVLIRKEGNHLILEPVPPASELATLLVSWQALENEQLPDVDEGLLPLDDIKL